jgi:OFA family oxalate/formate antiporter-like MFS transporter
MAVAAGEVSISRWWRVVGGLFMNLALGSLYGWSVFVLPLEKKFGQTPRAGTSRTFEIAVIVFALTFIVAGRLQDRYGPFWVSVAGGVLVSLGFFMSATADSLGPLYFWFGVVAGMGNGFGYATPIPVMSKWFPDKRGLAVGLAVAGYGGGSAIFAPLANNYLIPDHGLSYTFRLLGVVFLVMTMIGAFLLKNPPAGYKPPGWEPAPATAKAAASAYNFTPAETVRTPTFYFMWVAYCLGALSGLMMISQLGPFMTSVGRTVTVGSAAFVLVAIANASGRIFSGALSDALGRLNVLRLMIGVSAVAIPAVWGLGDTAAVFAALFVVYYCYGTVLSVKASTTADFYGTKHQGLNYGLLFTAWGVAGILGPEIGARLFDEYGNYQAAFYVAGVLAVVAFISEMMARRPSVPAAVTARAPGAVATS